MDVLAFPARGWLTARRADALRTRYAQLAAELDECRAAYRRLEREAGQARVDADGYRAAFLALQEEAGHSRREADGYKGAYAEAATEASRYRMLLRGATPPARGRQFVYLHVQKTGGISLLDFLGRQFEWYRTLWVFSPAEFDAHPPEEVGHFDRVCGHFSARNLAACRPGAFRATVLRDPADRLLSCYGYFRGYEGHPRGSIRHAVGSAKSNGLLDFLRDPTPEVRMHLRDHQAHCLAGDWAAPDDRPPADLRDDAVAALGGFDWVGRTEHLDADVGRLCRLTGWTPPDRLGRLNVTASRRKADELTPAEREAIAELVEVDHEVYAAANRLVAERGAAAGHLPAAA